VQPPYLQTQPQTLERLAGGFVEPPRRTGRGELVEQTPHQDEQHLPLGTKVPVKAAHRGVGALGDLLDRRRLKSVPREERLRGAQDRLAGPVAALLLGRRLEVFSGEHVRPGRRRSHDRFPRLGCSAVSRLR
jgi:hypothetical protein